MPNVSTSLGPLLIGVLLKTLLSGINIVQTFIYYRTFKCDRAWIRYFVLCLFILETASVACNIGLIYEPFILNYGEARSSTTSPKMLIVYPILAAVIAALVQFFISWRIACLSHSIIIPGVIVMCSLAALGGGSYLTYFVATTPGIPGVPNQHFTSYTIGLNVWLVMSAVADIIITVSLSTTLARSRTGMKATDDKIGQIIRFTIHTGLITSIMAVSTLIVAQAAKHTTINFIWDFALTNVYSNALLSTLNARSGWSNPAPSGTNRLSAGNPNARASFNVLFGEPIRFARPSHTDLESELSDLKSVSSPHRDAFGFTKRESHFTISSASGPVFSKTSGASSHEDSAASSSSTIVNELGICDPEADDVDRESQTDEKKESQIPLA